MRLLVVLLAAAIVACNPAPNPGPTPEPLADDQTLSFPIAQDVADFDPAMISSPADVDILRNVFSGLYRYDDQLKEVPDIAVGRPTISADGLTYTFHLRTDAKFSNGDPITAADFVFSWNRAAALQGDFAGLFAIIARLAKVDDSTFTATLTKPAGYFEREVGLWPFWVVDQKVIAAAGEDAWSTKPETLIGSGPFRMTARTPGQSMDFDPVADWYGGKTGLLDHVHVTVMQDTSNQVAQYEAGVFSLIGYARQALPAKDATRYATDANLKNQLLLTPIGTTFWVGFNLKSGPFAGLDKGRAGRHAFSTAIDRKALADALCNARTTCTEETGGVISKGLSGYLGDDQDSNVKFDAAAAKTEYKAWDPTGAKAKNLTYTYDSNAFNKAVCTNLQQQWAKNLSVTVTCVEMDRKTFFEQRNACGYAMFRQGWSADYDHPQDWFDSLFVSGAPSGGSCYSNPTVDKTVASADATNDPSAAADYRAAGMDLISDSAFAGLFYGVQAYLVHAYVKGAGGNALYDNYWTELGILRH